jgi:hypothetical protein
MMRKMTFLSPKKISPLLFLLLSSLMLFAGGGKNLNPNPGSSINNHGYLQTGDNGSNPNSGYFLAEDAPTSGSNFNPDHRLFIRIKPGETLYFGANRISGDNNLLIRIRDKATNNIVKSQFLVVGSGSRFQAGTGVINTAAQMNAGPSAVVGPSGYNAASYVHPTNGQITDLYVEFLDDVSNGNPVSSYTGRDIYDFWDFSVYNGLTEKKGRMFAKFWSFSAFGGNNALPSTFEMFTAVPNTTGNAYFIKGLGLGGIKPYGFFFVANETGTLTDANGNPSSDYLEQRISKNYNGANDDGYPQFENFVEDPDPEFWPSATVPNLAFTSLSTCDGSRLRGNLTVTFNQADPGVGILVINLNGVAGYQPGTTDVLIEKNFSTAGLNSIAWNGLNGLGQIVPSGQVIEIIFRYGVRTVHFPIFDVEGNPNGFVIKNYRPFVPSTFGLAFWDDRSISGGSDNTFNLSGLTSSSGVHPWTNGDVDLFNTWTFGALLENSTILPFEYDCTIIDKDADGVYSDVDLDDDNDGIPDLVENGGIDVFGDADGDGILNYLDSSFPGFIDLDNNGIDDRVDQDGDGIINSLDLDSDNDGVPDVVESGGVDQNGDGVIDNYSDADNDGFSDNVDGNLGGSAGSGNGLGSLDTDMDGIPNYLDLDSDNDGIPDIVESGGVDTNGDGYVDNYNRDTGAFTGSGDSDTDGYTDIYDGALCETTLTAISGNGSAVLIDQSVGNETNALGAINNTWAVLNDNFDELGLELSSLVPTSRVIDFRMRNLDPQTASITVEVADASEMYAVVNTFILPPNQGPTTYSITLPFAADRVKLIKNGDAGNVELDAVVFIYAFVTESCTANNNAFDITGPDTNGDGFADTYLVNSGSDADGDGIPSMWDLDSDNDGIYDVSESGGSDTDGNGRIDNYTDADFDGYSDSVDGNVGYDNVSENAANSLVRTGTDSGNGMPSNYPQTSSNADGTGVPNYLDVDSDNDGCSDADEAYASNAADGNDGGAYGIGNPPPTEADGSVSAASYPPVNSSVYDPLQGICFPPIAVDDEDLDNIRGESVDISILANDQLANENTPQPGNVIVDLDPSTPGNQAMITVDMVGTWTYANGVLTFEPALDFTGIEFTLNYTIEDINGNVSNAAEVKITYQEIVPVEWLSFDVEKRNDQVNLLWSTASEVDNDYFEVQRSRDGRYFEKIGRVDGSGTRTDVTSYNFVDRSPGGGINYYRIKQVDFDGTHDFSDVRTITVDDFNLKTIAIFPNPTVDFISIDVSLNNEKTTIIIRNMGGEVMARAYYQFGDRFNVSHLSNGVYIVELWTRQKKIIFNEKFVKI